MDPLRTDALTAFFERQRAAQWFTGKDRAIVSVLVLADAALPLDPVLRFALVEVAYGDGARETYHVPVVVDEDGGLRDALDDPRWPRAMATMVRECARLPTTAGTLVATATPGAAALLAGVEQAPVHRLGGPQSNVSLRVGERALFKAYRKPDRGVSIEREVATHLTTQGYANTPRLLGALSLEAGNTPSTSWTVGLVFEFVASDGDGWEHVLRGLCDGRQMFDELAVLGRRIGELHRALGAPTDDEGFRPIDVTADDLRAWSATILHEIDVTIALTRKTDPVLATRLDAAHGALAERARLLATSTPSGKKTRIHGDLHLGQVLARAGDFLVLDFEGEPARPKEQRRGKYAPLRDVAGMLRSLGYARAEATKRGAAVAPDWLQRASAALLDAYRAAVAGTDLVPGDPSSFAVLLDALELEKALYEVRYELVSRPDWVDIPASRLFEIAAS